MIENNKILAIIPARKGSKGVPNKNFAPFCNQTLTNIAIIEAKKSKYIDKIAVSSDYGKIKKAVESLGASMDFIRPQSLSNDNALSKDVIKHALKYYSSFKFKYFIYLQPTSPLRTYHHIDKSIKILHSKNSKSVISVLEVKHNPLFLKKIDEKDNLININNINSRNNNRQNYDKVYSANGAIYCANINYYLKNESFYGNYTKPLIMDFESSIDIDTIDDFNFAEKLYKIKSK